MALPAGFGGDASDEVDPETGHLKCLGNLSISDKRKAALTKAAVVGGWKWWCLSPVKQQYNTATDTDIGREAVQGMLDCISMRRGMDTILELPNHADGSPWLVCPRDGIPAHHIEYHELGHAALKPYMDDIMNAHFKDLAISVQEAGPVETMVAVPHGGEVSVSEDAGGGDEGAGVHLNNGLLRILNIGSMDVLSFQALQVPDEVAMQPDEVALEDLRLGGELTSTKARKVTKERSRKEDGKLLQLGSAHSEALLHGTGDWGLGYLQVLGLGADPFDVIPVERKAVLSRVLARSPVWTHTLHLCAQRANEGERVLVMVSTPWAQL